jgi:predicted ester cyclase
MMTTTANDNLAHVRQWTASVNCGTPAFAETFAPQVTMEIVGGSLGIHDLESYAIAMHAILAAFPGLQFTVDEQLTTGERGDVVVSRFTGRGTHRGYQLGFPATGKSVTFQDIVVDRTRDGKIVDCHEIFDALGLFQQLGVVLARPANFERREFGRSIRSCRGQTDSNPRFHSVGDQTRCASTSWIRELEAC